MERLVVTTDGSCEPNPGDGGWAYVTDTGLEAYGAVRNTTNNRMEILAVVMALEAAWPGQEVEIRSDSEYVCNIGRSWLSSWKRKGWKLKGGGPVKNRDLLERLDAAMQGRTMTWTWIKGHAGDPQNEKADELAGNARLGNLSA